MTIRPGAWWGGGLVCLAGLVFSLAWSASGRTAEDAEKTGILHTGKFEGASTCMNCHTRPTPPQERAGALDFVLLTEYATWKTLDKHSQAYVVLKGKRGQDMARLLKGDVSDASLDKMGCLNCHAMNFPKERKDITFSIEDGVSCGGCHGPSEKWFGDHSRPRWRNLTPEQKEALGMRNLRDPAVRSGLCISCHVGNAAEGKVVTHEMFAAGHPPLPSMEISTFSRNMPQHWRDLKDVPYFTMTEVPYLEERGPVPEETKRRYHFETADFQRTRQALIGSIVALRETMRLVADRANLDAPRPKQTWPEFRGEAFDALKTAAEQRWPELAFAHSDCYACHHDLKVPSDRQARGYGYRLPAGGFLPIRPGRPQVRQWSLAMVELAIRHTAASPAELKTGFDNLEERLKSLASTCDSRPFGNPAEVRGAALKMKLFADRLIEKLQAARYDRAAVLRLLRYSCTLNAAEFADVETARQIASVLQTAYSDVAGKDADPRIQAILQSLEGELNLRPNFERRERLTVFDDVLQKLAGKKVEGMEKFMRSLDDLTDRQRLLQLKDNDFLKALSDIPNPDFTKGLEDPKVLERLQDIDNRELAVTLEKIGTYDARHFKKQLQELSKHLPSK